MENKILAIKGHSTRDNEVIKILKMLGGQNISDIKGNGSYLYYIDGNNFISMTSQYKTNFIIFTLEQFLEKYPYKIGDKVLLDNQVKVIKGVGWDSNNHEVIYTLETNVNSVKTEYQVFNYDLQPYKEEIKAEDRLEIYADTAIDDDSKIDITIDGEKLIAPRGYTVKNATTNGNSLIVEYIKNKQYPKTYDECYEIMNIPENQLIKCGTYGYKAGLLSKFQELLICRDAYWKIAGDWEEKRKKEINHYVIYSTLNGGLVKDCLSCTMVKHLLDFPTKEMRDAFYENFKDLIEQCKEFL